MLDIQLHGLVARPNFVHATIVQSGKTIAAAGRVDAKRSIRREFDLTFSFNDHPYELGKLVLVASLDGIRDQVGREFLEILFGEAIVALLLASALLFLFHRQVGMHLHALAARVRDISPANLEQPIALCKRYRDDELDQVTASLEKMRRGLLDAFTKLSEEVEERRIAESRLSQAKEQAESATQAKTQFLANMSHEIRTPLNGVMGILQLLETSAEGQEQKHFCTLALQSANRLNRLLSDILDLSRVEAGKLHIQSEPFRLHETLVQVLDLFVPTAVQSGMELRHHVDPGVPDSIVGDPIRLQQVLGNLIGNAFKFTTTGYVNVEAYPLPAKHPGQLRIFFSVSDTGCGISDKDLENLFTPFTQVSQGYTKSHQGAGLGLSICKHLVTLMGGNMDVESETGVGTTFSFCVTVGKALGVAVVTAPAEIGASATANGRVLLAEDDEVTQFAVRKLLEKAGYTVSIARNGEEALDLLGAHDFDAVLMDIQMPVMGGIEATRLIRSSATPEAKRSIPIIALTAYAMAGDREKFLDAGMNDYIAKPVQVVELKKALERAQKLGKGEVQ